MRDTSVEEAQAPVGISFTVTQIATEETVAACAPVCGILWCRRQRRSNRACQLDANALISVEAEHPVVARRAHRQILLRPKAQPLGGDNARAVRRADLLRAVAASRIENDDFIGKSNDADQAIGDTLRLVFGDDYDADRGHGRFHNILAEECRRD